MSLSNLQRLIAELSKIILSIALGAIINIAFKFLFKSTIKHDINDINNLNHYEILEISSTASKEVIQGARDSLISKHFNDITNDNKNKEKAEKAITLISEAYNILSDTEKRKQYDKTLRKAETEKLLNSLQKNECKEEDYQKIIKLLKKGRVTYKFFFCLTLTLLFIFGTRDFAWIPKAGFIVEDIFPIFQGIIGMYTVIVLFEMSSHLSGKVATFTAFLGFSIVFAIALGFTVVLLFLVYIGIVELVHLLST